MVLKEEEEAWPEVQEEMNRSLATMRVDYDQVILQSVSTCVGLMWIHFPLIRLH